MKWMGYRLNCTRRTSRGRLDEWDDTALLTQENSSTLPLGSPHYWNIASERGRNILLLWNLKARVGFEVFSRSKLVFYICIHPSDNFVSGVVFSCCLPITTYKSPTDDDPLLIWQLNVWSTTSILYNLELRNVVLTTFGHQPAIHTLSPVFNMIKLRHLYVIWRELAVAQWTVLAYARPASSTSRQYTP